jgi:hypothetical protein
MTDMPTGQALLGKRALVLGIANEQSIAYGCAKVFRALGAELAVTYLNEKAKPYVAPLPEMDSRIFRPQSMGLRDDLLRVPLEQRFVYDPQQNVLFVNLSHFTVKTLVRVWPFRAGLGVEARRSRSGRRAKLVGPRQEPPPCLPYRPVSPR